MISEIFNLALSETELALLICLTGTILYLLFLRVRIYNFDGFGKYHYIGSTVFYSVQGVYTVKLTKKASWEAETDIYRFRPCFLFLLLHKGEQMQAVNPRNEKVISAQIQAQTECRLC